MRCPERPSIEDLEYYADLGYIKRALGRIYGFVMVTSSRRGDTNTKIEINKILRSKHTLDYKLKLLNEVKGASVVAKRNTILNVQSLVNAFYYTMTGVQRPVTTTTLPAGISLILTNGSIYTFPNNYEIDNPSSNGWQFLFQSVDPSTNSYTSLQQNLAVTNGGYTIQIAQASLDIEKPSQDEITVNWFLFSDLSGISICPQQPAYSVGWGCPSTGYLTCNSLNSSVNGLGICNCNINYQGTCLGSYLAHDIITNKYGAGPSMSTNFVYINNTTVYFVTTVNCAGSFGMAGPNGTVNWRMSINTNNCSQSPSFAIYSSACTPCCPGNYYAYWYNGSDINACVWMGVSVTWQS